MTNSVDLLHRMASLLLFFLRRPLLQLFLDEGQSLLKVLVQNSADAFAEIVGSDARTDLEEKENELISVCSSSSKDQGPMTKDQGPRTNDQGPRTKEQGTRTKRQ
jgi:hypothetical protein